MVVVYGTLLLWFWVVTVGFVETLVCRSVFCLGFLFDADWLVFIVLSWVSRLSCRLVDLGVLMSSGFGGYWSLSVGGLGLGRIA